ncbi:hypothetical protein CJF31_00006639 [Rutstroemia sp. NJR-2017a BVV2]|nr:hypothetical protein CJF31_00006639 [Rutstroemia sp. NJR-2017a BVV2]
MATKIPTMSQTKTIAILGATGNQGGSVATTFLSDPSWRVRALTRSPSSNKALALASLGAEIVHADMDSPASLSAAFADVHAIFAVSDFWGLYFDPGNKSQAGAEPLNVWAGKHETEQLKRVIDAAAQVPTLERFVLSSLSDVTRWSRGKYTHVYHFDAKARAEVYGRETYPELWARTSVVQAGVFLGNFVALPGMLPERTANSNVQFTGYIDADVKLPFIAAEEDTGPFVQALVQESAGKNLIGYRGWLSMREISAAFEEATGFKTEFVRLPKEQVNSNFPPELREEMDDTWAYLDEFGYDGRDDPTVVHPKDLESPPQLGSVVDWFKKQDWSKVLCEQGK